MSDPEPPDESAAALAGLTAQIQALSVRVLQMDQAAQRGTDRVLSAQATALRALELIHDDDPRARRRLRDLRSRPDYEQAFTARDPLVSIVIPTWNRPSTLIERSIPSALAQTHTNVEVIVVGDASPPEVHTAIQELGDARVSFHNLTIRGPYDEDPYTAWHAYGTPGMNAGLGLARGLWIAPLGDDDAFVPEHVEQLLAAARNAHFELAYAKIRMILEDGSESLVGEFMEFELGHALFRTPNDWGLVHRMMRTGVRMGMIAEVGVNYWPSRQSNEAQGEPAPPSGADELADQLIALERSTRDLRERLTIEQQRARELDAHATDLARRLQEVRHSRSWRWTAPLRRARARR
jgi:hypothetical protein